ncbi:ASCH domain-containing protein [Leptolyngbya sp. CCNP1308]|uniref:ASCH domain-containing protein n=1 Tax=Leptolyngbya sp. CCNP1308 TaxID=3110255 RepID=UPI002B2094FF|nr:ASCH domain-containing protein [Leptolyngbya sp. CCNP1308]MEA5448463.1 ASCH domain-containing protein [Leptolyngbya sp. CCNP1308]
MAITGEVTQGSLLPLADELQLATQGDPFWENYLIPLTHEVHIPFSLHLGIFVEPYLQFILDGKKTIESRFSTRRFAPYEQIQKGDVILLKKSSGPITGICQVSHCWFYRLDPNSWKSIKQDFAEAICAQDPDFWEQRQSATYATLVRIKNIKEISPIKFAKRDRRGWVVLQHQSQQLSLDLNTL